MTLTVLFGMLDSKTKKVEQNEGRIRKHLCITLSIRNVPIEQEMLTIDDILKDILRVPTFGVIPECLKRFYRHRTKVSL